MRLLRHRWADGALHQTLPPDMLQRLAQRITASEQEGLLAWQVQFTLREYNSVPEKREQRMPKTPATVGQGTANTKPAKPADGNNGKPATEQEQLSSWEQAMKGLDNKLGDLMA